MKYPKDSSLPHPGIHQAKVDARLNTVDDRLDAVEADVKATYGRMITKVIHEDNNSARLNKIDSEIKYMKEAIEDLDNSYHDIEIRIEKLEEMTDGID